MSEPGLRIGGRDCIQGPPERCVEPAAGAGAGLAQGGFELGPALFDRVEVGGIRRERFQPCAPGSDGLGNPGRLVHGQVIQHDDIARLKGRPQHRFDPGAKDCGVDRTVDRHRGTDSCDVQGRQQRDVLPTVVRHALHHPHARGSASVKLGQGQVYAGLIDELQTSGGIVPATTPEGRAQTLDPRRVALTGLKRSFLSGNLSR